MVRMNVLADALKVSLLLELRTACARVQLHPALTI